MKRIVIHVTQPQAHKLEEMAERLGLSLSELVRRLLDRVLEMEKV